MTKPRQIPEPAKRAVLDMDPAELAAEISKLPPNDQYVVAARVGAEVSQARREHQEQMRDASKAVAGDKSWRGYADRRIPHAELERRRAEPRIPAQRQTSRESVERAVSAAREEPAQWAPAPAAEAGAAQARGC